MAQAPSFKEEYISQIPALQLLMQLGFSYLTPQQALTARAGKQGNVVLTDILSAWLKKNNTITYKDQPHEFSDANIDLAIQQLLDYPSNNLIHSNELIYDHLTLGISLKQTIGGDTRSHSLKFIDWKHPENNVYHVTDEFSVERTRSQKTRRPDIVCFVNGIPLVVIECKRPDKTNATGDKSVYQGISQLAGYQENSEIPHLFLFSQLLMSISTNDAMYATTKTPRKFWAIWKEEQADQHEPYIREAINDPLSDAEKDHLYNHRENGGRYVRKYFDDLVDGGERFPTTQDRSVYALMRPERLMKLLYQYIVFDGGVKKIARYQQFFAVKATMNRVHSLNSEGKRNGGVIWHTTGTGKSLTMVMLAKSLSLAPNVSNPKVVLVTDRIDLDDQIWGTFKACGKNAIKAKHGKHLVKLVDQPNADIITTVIDKFETAAKAKAKNDNPNIFVLVDESHRSQYGTTHAMMRLVFPNACYIGFTGTPLLAKEKGTLEKFGGKTFIHSYPMRQAVEDEAVVPLLYEGRMVELEPEQQSIDLWFERITKDLSDEQKKDLKQKFSRQDQVNQTDQRIQQIAYDITRHYVDNHQHTGHKAQFAAPNKEIAIKYHQYLEDFGEVESAVIISAPDSREGNDADDSKRPLVKKFWDQMMDRYGSETKYIKSIVDSFSREDGIEIIIVVDKLLTGFDEPRNTVLYIDKPLKEHGLLQAIARVNRLFENKDYGFIIDYRGVLGKLNEAINVYDALAEFDTEDIAGTVIDISQVLRDLPQLHANIWSVFRPVVNKKDPEQLQLHLEPEDIRDQFYQALREFTTTLKVALGSERFYEEVPESKINTYKHDLTFFHNLRNSVKLRFGESVSYGEYEQKIKKLLDQHIRAVGQVQVVTPPVDIFDVEAFSDAIEQIDGEASRADTIAHQMKRVITQRMEEDPAFYKNFSDLIDEAISDYKNNRLNEAQYLEKIKQYHSQFTKGKSDSVPEKLRHMKHAAAYYGIVKETIVSYLDDTPETSHIMADVGIRIEEIIESLKIRDWEHNEDVKNHMKNGVEDYLYSVKGRYNVDMSHDEIEVLIDQIIYTAQQRNHL